MANKLLKPKRGKVENLNKLPIEDGSLIFAYSDDAETSTVLVDIGERRLSLSSSYSAYADNAGKLEGHTADYFAPASSLEQFADKTAFNALDSQENNTIVLTRANGGTAQKIINNVANATSAKISDQLGNQSIGTTSIPIFLENGIPREISALESTLIKPILINGTNLDNLRNPGFYYAAGGNTNSNKPENVDAFGLVIIQSSGGWYTQILYASNNIQKSYVRYYNSTSQSWSLWEENNRLNTKDLSGYVAAPTAAGANKIWRTDVDGNPFWGGLDSLEVDTFPSTVTLGEGRSALIDQNAGDYRQRFVINDGADVNSDVFIFQLSSNGGESYQNLFSINGNSVVTASTFLGNLNGYAKDSFALGGSSLSNILDKIDSSVAANDAMVYLGTIGNVDDDPTISVLPSTAKVGSSYKVISDGIYGGITAEIGDLLIYSSVGWTLIPSGDDGNVFIGDSKTSIFPYKDNNLVVAIGDQKVTSSPDIIANSGTLIALGSSVNTIVAESGTITNLTGTLDGTAKNADTLDNFHAVNSSSLTLPDNSDKIVLAKNIVDYIDAQAFATTAQVQSSITWIEF